MEDLCTENGDGLCRKDGDVREGRWKGNFQGNDCAEVRVISSGDDESLTGLVGGGRIRMFLITCQHELQLLRDI